MPFPPKPSWGSFCFIYKFQTVVVWFRSSELYPIQHVNFSLRSKGINLATGDRRSHSLSLGLHLAVLNLEAPEPQVLCSHRHIAYMKREWSDLMGTNSRYALTLVKQIKPISYKLNYVISAALFFKTTWIRHSRKPGGQRCPHRNCNTQAWWKFSTATGLSHTSCQLAC